MKFKTKYKLLKLKAYFDKGFGILHYFRYVVLVFMLNEVQKENARIALMITLGYGVVCFVVGYCWYKYGWVLAEAEVGNRFNLFQREVRTALKKKRFK